MAEHKKSGYFSYINNIGILTGSADSDTVVYNQTPMNLISYPVNFMNSIAFCATPPDTRCVLNIVLDGGTVGTVAFNAGSHRGIFALANNLIMNVGDTFSIKIGTSDSAIANIELTLKGIVYIPPISFTLMPTFVEMETSTLTVGGTMITNNSPIVVGISQDNSTPPTSWTSARIGDQVWIANIDMASYTYNHGIVWAQYVSDPSSSVLGQFIAPA